MTARFTFDELLSATGGKPLTSLTPLPPAGLELSTDSRTIGPGYAFIPLVGTSFDGHRFITEGYSTGVIAAFVNLGQWEANQAEWQTHPNLIGVENTLQAYQNLGRYHRTRLAPALKVIGLTGSSGKTTVKEMLYGTFSPLLKTQKTQKNFNNEIGVPLTLLGIENDTRLAIVEMGMRGLKQIEELTLCARPDIGLITNVGPAHIEILGSLENIARAKLEMVAGLDPETGVLITNGDDLLLEKLTPQLWRPKRPEQWQRFTLKDASEIAYTEGGGMRFLYQGHTIELPLPGEHMVANALAVLKTAEVLGFSVEQALPGLNSAQSETGRWTRLPLEGYQDSWVINDAYNANPDSCKASLKAFLQSPLPKNQKRVVILAGMLELGEQSEQYHQELGLWLSQQKNLDALITVGKEAETIADLCHDKLAIHGHADTVEQIPALIRQYGLKLDHSTILLKGSRGYQLEQLLTLLTPAAP